MCVLWILIRKVMICIFWTITWNYTISYKKSAAHLKPCGDTSVLEHCNATWTVILGLVHKVSTLISQVSPSYYNAEDRNNGLSNQHLSAVCWIGYQYFLWYAHEWKWRKDKKYIYKNNLELRIKIRPILY